jgi:hypothetical protein
MNNQPRITLTMQLISLIIIEIIPMIDVQIVEYNQVSGGGNSGSLMKGVGSCVRLNYFS